MVLQDHVSGQWPPAPEAAQQTHRDRDAAPASVALDPVDRRRRVKPAGDHRVKAAAAEISQGLERERKLHRLQRQGCVDRRRQRRRGSPTEGQVVICQQLLVDPLDYRHAFLRKGDPHLHGRACNDIRVPDFYRERKLPSAYGCEDPGSQEGIELARAQPPQRAGRDHELPGAAGAVGHLDHQLLPFRQQVRNMAGQR